MLDLKSTNLAGFFLFIFFLLNLAKQEIMGLEKFCQSCMLPKDHEIFEKATEQDGTENGSYCKLCYVEGEFTQQETIKSAKDMQNFVKGVLKKQGVGKVKRWFYTIGIPRLERWNKN
jgi:hypothetical protein